MSESGPDPIPAISHRRTELERLDQGASWVRPDEAFFAAGACHVLAFALMARHPRKGRTPVLLRPTGGLPGSHVYVRCGVWAFDFNGWATEEALIASNTTECLRRWPTWDCDRIAITEPIETFCQTWNHRLPKDFAGDVMARANAYLDGFPGDPPTI